MICSRTAVNVLLAMSCTVVSTVSSSTFALTAAQRAQGLTSEDLEANKKKLGDIVGQLTTTQSREKESRFKFDGMLNYGIRQDLAQERSPVLTTHRVTGTGSMTILDRPVVSGVDDELAEEVVTISTAVSGQFATLDQEIQGNVQGGAMKSGDFDISASRGFSLNPLWSAKSSLDFTLGSSLPYSDDSRYEGVIVAPYANLGWALAFAGGRYNLTQNFSADYVVNRFTHSPVTHEVNPEGSAGYSISTSARLGAGFRFTVGGSARLIQHLDQTVTSSLNNFQILSWTKAFTTISLRHSNGSRAEDHLSSFWFVDEYRRIISLSLSVRF